MISLRRQYSLSLATVAAVFFAACSDQATAPEGVAVRAPSAARFTQSIATDCGAGNAPGTACTQSRVLIDESETSTIEVTAGKFPTNGDAEVTTGGTLAKVGISFFDGNGKKKKVTRDDGTDVENIETFPGVTRWSTKVTGLAHDDRVEIQANVVGADGKRTDVTRSIAVVQFKPDVSPSAVFYTGAPGTSPVLPLNTEGVFGSTISVTGPPNLLATPVSDLGINVACKVTVLPRPGQSAPDGVVTKVWWRETPDQSASAPNGATELQTASTWLGVPDPLNSVTGAKTCLFSVKFSGAYAELDPANVRVESVPVDPYPDYKLSNNVVAGLVQVSAQTADQQLRYTATTHQLSGGGIVSDESSAMSASLTATQFSSSSTFQLTMKIGSDVIDTRTVASAALPGGSDCTTLGSGHVEPSSNDGGKRNVEVKLCGNSLADPTRPARVSYAINLAAPFTASSGASRVWQPNETLTLEIKAIDVSNGLVGAATAPLVLKGTSGFAGLVSGNKSFP